MAEDRDAITCFRCKEWKNQDLALMVQLLVFGASELRPSLVLETKLLAKNKDDLDPERARNM